MKRMFLALSLFVLTLCAQAQNYQQTVRAALDALAADSLQLADSLLRRALRQEPALKSNAILFQHLGHIQERRGQYEQALES